MQDRSRRPGRLAGLAVIASLTGLAGCGERAPAPGQPLGAADFRRELIGMPLCGIPKTGTLAGKTVCSVYLADGTAILAGAGQLARGRWDTDGDRICRRDVLEPPDRRVCVGYERLPQNRYRNSDGVEFCIGPCP
jgi:hypothetical protein